jgi:biopolymer transport protein ExbD
MADVSIKTDNTRRSGRRHPLRVDLTAMVDLGFLLITFFMLASNMSKFKIREMLKPDTTTDITQDVPKSQTYTLLLGSNNKVYAYNMEDDVTDLTDVKIDSVSYDHQLRNLILNRKKEVNDFYGESRNKNMYLIIKPTASSSMRNLVDILDEIEISNVKSFVIVKPSTAADSTVIKHIHQL